VLPEVLGKWSKNRMGITCGVHGPGQVMVKALDGFADAIGGFLGGIPGAPRMLFLVFIESLQLALDLRFDRPGLAFIVEDGFQLLLFAAQGPCCVGVVESEAALLNDGVVRYRDGFSGGRVHDFGGSVGLVADGLTPQCQGNGVDRFGGWVQQEVRDVGQTLLVFQDGVLAGKGELPIAMTAAEAVGRDCQSMSR